MVARAFVLAAGLTVAVSCAAQAPATPATQETKMEYPRVVLSNDKVKMTVYLPDPNVGFYRAGRFDWSGLVARAEWSGHTFYGPFRVKHDPLGGDSVVGPATEFSMEDPPGYDEVQAGGTFIKIGVGLLEKAVTAKEPNYCFWKPYKLVNTGEWKVSSGKDWVEFRQDLQAERDWAYSYTKKVALSEKSPGFVISHVLKNVGKKVIDTTQYNHNFTIIDDTPIGPDYRIKLGVAAPTIQVVKAGKAEVKGRDFVLVEEQKGSLWAQLGGVEGKVEENHFVIENARTGAALKIEGSLPVFKIVVYGEKTAICPEPFVRVKVEPGKETAWSATYTFLASPAAATKESK